jgi:integrase
MPRLVNRPPAYTHHKPSGRARVRFQGRDHWLPGKYGSKESREAYARFVATLSDGEAFDPRTEDELRSTITINELVLAYKKHAEAYYRKDGEPTGEHEVIKYALRPMRRMFGSTLAVEFGPKRLKMVRDEMISKGWSRRHINSAVGRIKRCFTWGASEELIPGSVALNLRALQGLKKDRSDAREKPEVAAVPDEHIEAILHHVSPNVRDLIMVQRLTGMRPSEALNLTVEAIDRSDPECWTYRPGRHKSEHRGKDRRIFLGPKVQQILLRRIMAAGSGQILRMTLAWYRKAIRKACAKAKVARWTPNMLRHSFATEVRSKFGLEASQTSLGHTRADVTQIYAERDWGKAREVARMVG